MLDPETLIALATKNPRGLALLALYLVLSGLVSGLLARRSQVDAWAESRPRLAGALKLVRSVGLDPWIFVQGLSLLFRGKLPEKLKTAQVEAKRQETIKPPPKPPSIPPLAAMLCLSLLALVACGSGQPRPCSAEDTAVTAKLAECKMRQLTECKDVPAAECPVTVECKAWIRSYCGGVR